MKVFMYGDEISVGNLRGRGDLAWKDVAVRRDITIFGGEEGDNYGKDLKREGKSKKIKIVLGEKNLLQ